MTTPSTDWLKECLAYEVVCDAPHWLGEPSPVNLQTFLFGVEERAVISGSRVERWRISGPLCEPSFDTPILQETGHPTLTIRWARALELIHFSMSSALTDLKQRIEQWSCKHEPNTTSYSRDISAISVENLFEEMAARPGMFLGTNSGVSLQQYLLGATVGGDWLGLPQVQQFTEVRDKIEQRSVEAYGSRFGAYRVYRDNQGAAELLIKWADIQPVNVPALE
ncbi:MAG: hypothetical protein AAF773_21830 [Cyanobacteria bacterium P01_D01_bin.115]